METLTDVAFGGPHPALTEAVERYIGYRMEGFAPGLHRGIPSRHLTFIISLSDPVAMELPATGYSRIDRHQAFVGGLDTAPALIHHDGDQYGIAIETTPFGASQFFGLPPLELTGLVVGLSDVLGAVVARNLPERLRDARDWQHRFAILDHVLCERLDSAYHVPDDIIWAWNALAVHPGEHAVSDLADQLGWSRRHFTQRFKEHVGLVPRQFQRVARFERSSALFAAGHSTNDVVAAAGYYDHAHLLHEWHKLAGCRPVEWQTEVLPSVQDAGEQLVEDEHHD